jgi:hypothetical protein
LPSLRVMRFTTIAVLPRSVSLDALFDLYDAL